MPSVPTVDDVQQTGGSNLKPGIAGGVGYGLGSAMFGPALGRPIGGVVSGAAVGGQKGSTLAMLGIANGIEAMISPNNTRTSGSQTSGVK